MTHTHKQYFLTILVLKIEYLKSMWVKNMVLELKTISQDNSLLKVQLERLLALLPKEISKTKS